MRVKQKGISLLELMVALTIGILLLLGLASIYQVANQANQDNAVISSNADTARTVFDRLAYDFKRAGFVDLYDKPTERFTPSDTSLTCPNVIYLATSSGIGASSMPVYGSILANKTKMDVNALYLRWKPDATPTSISTNIAPLEPKFMSSISYISCGNMRPVFGCTEKISDKPSIQSRSQCVTGGNSDSIEIAYQATKANGGSAQDCSFVDIGSKNQNGFVINRYFLKNDSKNHNISSFACVGNAGGSEQILVPGVSEMRFRYVMTPPEKDEEQTLLTSDSGKLITAYRKADEIECSDSKKCPNSLGWSGVVGVEVCLIVSTPLPDGSNNKALANLQTEIPTCERESDSSFKNGKVKPNDDKRFYERYIRTFSLPNSLYSPLSQ